MRERSVRKEVPPTASAPKSDEADHSQGSGPGRATLSAAAVGLVGKMDASLFEDDASFEKQYCEHEERIEIDAPAFKSWRCCH